jgi:glutaredoxin-like protein
MSLLDDRTRGQVQSALAGLTEPVKLLVFTQGEGGAIECTFCEETRHIAEELSALSEKITLEVRDFVKDEEQARAHGVDKIPAIVLLADGDRPRDHGIRFYGLPSGYEFGTLIEGLRMVSAGNPGLSEKTMQALSRLDRPVHIQVYVTPT